MPTTAEKIQALVAEREQRKIDKESAAEQARQAVASKKRAAVALQEQTAAAAAAAAEHAALKASTYRMPSADLKRAAQPHKKMGRRPATTERIVAAHVEEAPQLPPAATSAAAAATTADVVVAPESAIFVHFIPPPLRARDKPDLPWIVHTCNGSGCREAKHVSFMSVTGFSTYEGAPPEVADGVACGCTIANHHLRGHGTVRWEGECAIVEDDAEVSSIDGRAYMAKAKKLTGDVAQCREQIKAMRVSEAILKKRVDELRVELAGRGVSISQIAAAAREREARPTVEADRGAGDRAILHVDDDVDCMVDDEECSA